MTRYIAFLFFCGLAVPAYAQSPNTAALVIEVIDQTGDAVPGAVITVANAATGDVRETASGAQGSATIGALPVAGTYTVRVAKTGFTADDLRNIVLRAGETAVVRVKVRAGGGTTEVTVYGTTEGVGRDPQLGVRLDNQRIEETPNLGRKITALPLLNAAFRSAKGTGDLFLNNPLFVANAGGRRQTTVAIDGATGDEPWGRQSMFANVPEAAVQEMAVLSSAFSSEFGWTSSSALNIVTKSGSNQFKAEVLFLGRPAGPQGDSVDLDGTIISTADGSSAGRPSSPTR